MRLFFIRQRQRPEYSILVLSYAAVPILFVLYVILFAKHPARSNLPRSAEDIHEFQSSYSGVTMDFYYLLKAKFNHDEFAKYVNKMRLVEVTDGQEVERDYHWMHFSEQAWWKPSENFSSTYHDTSTKGSLKILAKYEKGYLYFQESCGY